MKLKRIIAVFTAAAMLLVPMDCALAGTAQQAEGEKQYVILAEDGAAYSEAEEETGEVTKEPEYEWNLKAVSVDETAEGAETVSKKVKVAVFDSGVDYVTGINMTGYVNFVEEESYVAPIFQDLTGHGTGVASIITGNGEIGLYGVNPNAKLYIQMKRSAE